MNIINKLLKSFKLKEKVKKSKSLYNKSISGIYEKDLIEIFKIIYPKIKIELNNLDSYMIWVSYYAQYREIKKSYIDRIILEDNILKFKLSSGHENILENLPKESLLTILYNLLTDKEIISKLNKSTFKQLNENIDNKSEMKTIIRINNIQSKITDYTLEIGKLKKSISNKSLLNIYFNIINQLFKNNDSDEIRIRLDGVFNIEKGNNYNIVIGFTKFGQIIYTIGDYEYEIEFKKVVRNTKFQLIYSLLNNKEINKNIFKQLNENIINDKKRIMTFSEYNK